jgi:hypothetical protein
MDNEDKEFETFLGQFELRKHRGLPMEAPVEAARRTHRWIWTAAAAVIVASVLSIPVLRNFTRGASGAIVEAAGDSNYATGDTIAANQAIRSGSFDPAILRLADGTRVEMRAQSEVVIDTVNDGIRVRLSSGSILVEAAKQHDGHLYVETEDTVVSVVGTMFLVERTSLGTRVGVCEGEVEVRQGLVLRKLIPGQQASTNPSMEGSLVEAISWSSSAPRLIALLRPPAVPQQSSPTTPEQEKKDPPKEPPATPKAPAQDEPKTEKPVSPPAPRPKKEPRGSDDVAPPTEQPQPDAGSQEAGKEILAKACGLCHAIPLAESARYSSQEAYASLINRQKAYGAPISDDEVKVLSAYLFRTYGIRAK